MPNNKIKILDIPIFAGNLKQAVEIILEALQKERINKCISLSGAHGLVYSKQNKSYREILQSFYLSLPDGMPCVWIGHIKGRKGMGRCYGPDLFMEIIKATAGKEVKHFLCGGKRGVAEELKNVCEEKFGNFNVAGTYYPPFREMTNEEFIKLGEEISSKEVNIVWIGISTPKQELFAKKLANYTKVNFIIAVGAAFDFHTNKIKQAPKVMQNLGLEWLFRLIIEPKRLWRRYAVIVPLFIFYNLKELITGRFFK